MMTRLKNFIGRYEWSTVLNSFVRMMWFKVFSQPYTLVVKKFCKVEEKKALFISSPAFADNGKAMYEYLFDNTDMKFVWVFINPKTKESLALSRQIKNNRTKVVYLYDLSIIKEYATSRYIFFTHGYNKKFAFNRKYQKVINLWHGNGYKGGTVSEKSKGEYFDKALVSGPAFVKTKSEYWGCPEIKLLPIGYPRYDIMFQKSVLAESYVRRLKGNNKVFIMWMPTYRKTSYGKNPEEKVANQYDIPLLKNIDEVVALNEICKENSICLCIKRHGMQLRYSCEEMQFSNIVFVSNVDLSGAGVELYSMLQYTDGLISDYSSITVDYLLLDKPMAFSLDDFEQYKNSRGFVFENPLDYMPGHHLYNLDDMRHYLEDMKQGKDVYKGERYKVLPLMQTPCGNYRERIWLTIKD